MESLAPQAKCLRPTRPTSHFPYKSYLHPLFPLPLLPSLIKKHTYRKWLDGKTVRQSIAPERISASITFLTGWTPVYCLFATLVPSSPTPGSLCRCCGGGFLLYAAGR